VENFEELRAASDRVNAQVMDLGEALRIAFTGGLDAAKDFGDGMPTALAPITPAIEEIIAPVDDLAVKMEDIGKSIADNFVGRMTDMAQGGKDALGGFFTWIKNQLVELAVKFLIFQTITGLFKSTKGAKWLEDLTGFSSPVADAGSGMDFDGFKKVAFDPFGGGTSAMVSSRGASASPQVNQVINFTVSAIDGRDAARFIREQGGEIANVVATAAKDSVGYRAALQGA